MIDAKLGRETRCEKARCLWMGWAVSFLASPRRNRGLPRLRILIAQVGQARLVSGRGRIASLDAIRVRGNLHELSALRVPLTRRAFRASASPRKRGEAKTESIMPRGSRPARTSLRFQLLIDDLDRAVDLGAGSAELVRDQFDQEIDPLDEGGAGSHGAGRR